MERNLELKYIQTNKKNKRLKTFALNPLPIEDTPIQILLTQRYAKYHIMPTIFIAILLNT